MSRVDARRGRGRTYADLAKALVLVTGALFAATYGLHRKTAETLDYARADAEKARKQTQELFTAERRSWLQIAVKIACDMRATDRGVEFDVIFTVTNVGLSPAFNIKINSRLMIETVRLTD